jgi:chemotaxis protein MotA
MTALVNPAAAVLVVLGGLISLLISQPWKNLAAGLKGLRFIGMAGSEAKLRDVLTRLASEVRAKDSLALEQAVTAAKEPFLRNALKLCLDDGDPEELRGLLERRRGGYRQSFEESGHCWECLANAFSAWGLIGALCGLLFAAAHCAEPDTMPPYASFSLCSALYGSVLSGAVTLPLAARIRAGAAVRLRRYGMIITGLASIQSGDSPQKTALLLKTPEG